MEVPRISVVEPLSPAWERTRRLLFRPFDLGRWLVLGFSAWLAALGGRGGSFHLQFPFGGWGDTSDWARNAEDAERVAFEAWRALAAGGCLLFLVVGCLLAVLLLLVLLWVSSRGKLVFLDNVVRERAEIVDPWQRLSKQGDSLFLFRLLFGLTLLLLAGLAAATFLVAVGGIAGLDRLRLAVGAVSVGLLVALACLAVLCALAAALVSYFLEAFVVPLMHRHGLGVLDGWRRFLVLLRARPLPFLLSGLLLLVLHLGVGAVVLAAGLMTCCLGFLVLMVPYVGTVLLLPIPVFVRAYTVELLAQADPSLLPGPPVEPAA